MSHVDNQDYDYNYDGTNGCRPQSVEYYQWQQDYDQGYYHHDQEITNVNTYSNFNQKAAAAGADQPGLRFLKTGFNPVQIDSSKMI